MEDTWFLTDILIEILTDQYYENKNMLFVCELGIGTGYISLNLSQKFPKIRIIGVDLSLEAVQLAYRNLRKSIPEKQFDLICNNLLDPFFPRTFKPDIIFFNPPYVITSSSELHTRDPLTRTWAGGPDGIAVIQQFLSSLTNFSFGRAFFLTSSLNDNHILETNFAGELHVKQIAKRLIGDEELICYQVTP
jgi:methylase of polypeptide subunit release factors